jgi:steroid delta-isomerase-like uncharacterized protein
MKKLCMILPLALILCFTVACQDKEAMAELEAMKAQAEVEEQNKEIIKRLFDELNKGNYDIFNELYAPGYAWYTPSRNTNSLSREATVEALKNFYRAFPDLNWSIEELIAVGDKVINRLIYRGTHKEEFQGIPATGNEIECSAIMIVRIEDGKVVEDREEFDMLGFMQQLGMELKPKEGEK